MLESQFFGAVQPDFGGGLDKLVFVCCHDPPTLSDYVERRKSGLGMFAGFHVSMKACKHEVANGLVAFGGGYLDGPDLLAGQANLQRHLVGFGIGYGGGFSVQGLGTRRCGGLGCDLRGAEGVGSQCDCFSHELSPFEIFACLHASMF